MDIKVTVFNKRGRKPIIIRDDVLRGIWLTNENALDIAMDHARILRLNDGQRIKVSDDVPRRRGSSTHYTKTEYAFRVRHICGLVGVRKL